MEEPIKVLIVDDDMSMLETTADILDARGYQVATAEDGIKAIAKAGETTFDLALIDIRMPGINGVETYREIKKISPSTRVIMMTAYAVDDLVKHALDEGAFEVLYKPLDIQRIMELIESAMRKIIILVVDDDPGLCETIKDVLMSKACDIYTAGDGEEAMELAIKVTPDLAFIDVRLPTINGLETYLGIRKVDPKAVAIMMTGHREETSNLIQEAIANGAFMCLYKPFAMDVVIKLVDNIRKEKRSGDNRDVPRTQPTNSR